MRWAFVEQRKPKLGLYRFHAPEMSNEIFCFLVGGLNVFPITISETVTVGRLKDIIKGKKQALKDIDADRLTLHLVTISGTVRRAQLIDELNTFPEDSPECILLDDDIEPFSSYFGGTPAEKKCYILVRAPEGEFIYRDAVAETVLTRPFILC